MAKDKFFSLRLSQALAERIERAKGYFGGGISMGEVARQLMERGLDQIDQTEPTTLWSLQKRPREALMALLSRRRDQSTLDRAEWAFLAQYVHRTYLRSRHRRDVVSRDLLVDNFRAFQEVIRIENAQYGKHRNVHDDQYYMGNFGSYGQDIEACTEAAIKALPTFPGSFAAEYGSRNLKGILRGQQLESDRLNTHLAPYFESLLQVALRGYWVDKGATIFDDPEMPSDSKRFTDRLLPDFQNDDFELSTLGFESELMAGLTFKDLDCTMALNNYVELTEFAHLVWAAQQSDGRVGMVRSDPFSVSWQRTHEGSRRYFIAPERVRFILNADRMAALGDLFTEAFSHPDMEVLMARLAFVHGRI